MTPLLCACAVVITLETQKCRKRASHSVKFNFFNNCDRQKRCSQNERKRADLQNLASDFLIFCLTQGCQLVRFIGHRPIFYPLSDCPSDLTSVREMTKIGKKFWKQELRAQTRRDVDLESSGDRYRGRNQIRSRASRGKRSRRARAGAEIIVDVSHWSQLTNSKLDQHLITVGETRVKEQRVGLRLAVQRSCTMIVQLFAKLCLLCLLASRSVDAFCLSVYLVASTRIDSDLAALCCGFFCSQSEPLSTPDLVELKPLQFVIDGVLVQKRKHCHCWSVECWLFTPSFFFAACRWSARDWPILPGLAATRCSDRSPSYQSLWGRELLISCCQHGCV